MSRRIKASLAAVAVAIAFVAAVVAAPVTGNTDVAGEPVAYILGFLIETT